MSVELWILGAIAVLAVVAMSAAVIAVRAARRVAQSPTPPPPTLEPHDSSLVVTHDAAQPARMPKELEPRLVEGRLVVPPSRQQVVNTALGRPGVRLSIFAHGVVHALRPESRDRITSMMRREYRRRRRERLRAGRRAVRAGRPTPPSDQWLGGS